MDRFGVKKAEGSVLVTFPPCCSACIALKKLCRPHQTSAPAPHPFHAPGNVCICSQFNFMTDWAHAILFSKDIRPASLTNTHMAIIHFPSRIFTAVLKIISVVYKALFLQLLNKTHMYINTSNDNKFVHVLLSYLLHLMVLKSATSTSILTCVHSYFPRKNFWEVTFF